MTCKRRAPAISVLILLLLPVVPLASELPISYYRRWQVSGLLATLRTLTPGTTTEAQTRAALQPFDRYAYASDRRYEGRSIQSIDYQFFNGTEWAGRLTEHLPIRLILPSTLVLASVNFETGTLAELDMTEMQEDIPGMPHPNAASVTIRSNRLTPPIRSPYGPTPEGFSGYSTHSQSTGAMDGNRNWTGFSCCHTRHILLDERASPTQHQQSLNFQLHCMTSYLRCKDDRAILP